MSAESRLGFSRLRAYPRLTNYLKYQNFYRLAVPNGSLTGPAVTDTFGVNAFYRT